MRRDLATVLDVLELPLRYEHNGVIKGRFGENFDKTRDSTVVDFDWIRG